MIYDINGNPLSVTPPVTRSILVGAVLDATDDAARFSAMAQLFDIGKKRLANPDAVIADSEFTYATKGAVCALPVGNPAMYEQYSFNMLYSKNATVQAVPASVTKVMSMITGLDFVHDVKRVVEIVSSDPVGGSGAYFSAGDTMTIEELMLSMMLPSSNTAANAFARICGEAILKAKADGTYTDTECRNAFIAQMNTKAAYIGMENSTFTSPSGLLYDTYTTASDLIQMTIEACSYPEILKVWNKKSYTIAVGGSNPRDVELTMSSPGSAIESNYYVFGRKTGSLSGTPKSLVMVAGIK